MHYKICPKISLESWKSHIVRLPKKIALFSDFWTLCIYILTEAATCHFPLDIKETSADSNHAMIDVQKITHRWKFQFPLYSNEIIFCSKNILKFEPMSIRISDDLKTNDTSVTNFSLHNSISMLILCFNSFSRFLS